MFQSIIGALACGDNGNNDGGGNKNKKMKCSGGKKMVKATVVLMKNKVLAFNDNGASCLDRFHELIGNKVSLQLVSCDVHGGDPSETGLLQGKLGEAAHLENWITTFKRLPSGESAFNVKFDWEEGFGVPGAFIIKNNHHAEFYLRTVTLEDVPDHGHVHFVCNSWVYPTKHCKQDRVFFVNKTFLPHQTPEPLRFYRKQELENLRGHGTGKLKKWDRVYDYAYYNDLGVPENERPVLGGSLEYPYPRRGRTGRPSTKKDPKTESRIPLMQSLSIYVPRDEQFSHIKMKDFLKYGLSSIAQFIKPAFEAAVDSTPWEFDTLDDVLKMYDYKESASLHEIRKKVPFKMLKEIFHTDRKRKFPFPTPQVIEADSIAWRTDEEFAREMLAGLNPVVIRCLKEFPPTSKLDSKKYGNQKSTITKEHIEGRLGEMEIKVAIDANRLFILDHHDALMPYLRRINTTTTKTYASRTILFLKDDGTLKPLVIELSLPHPEGDEFGAISKVYTPPKYGVKGVEDSIWQLAKAYVAVNDSGYHQLISHWLNTHAVIEPFVIATNRQLSVLHPIHKLLHPHFRDTMNINAFARQTLINAGGILEFTVFPSKYALELSSSVYKNWIFTEQALPADLKKRGMLVDDPNAPPHNLRLLIEDYPYAVDGLEIWFAIEKWVKNYCSFYYNSDEMVQNDLEIQAWWKELREEGHGDLKDKPWWPKMQTRDDLIESCTIIIWVASALHAAVNFGQYPYAGYLPNRPTVSRRFMPEEGTREFEELKENPDKAFLQTITAQLQTLVGVSLIEILSRHSTDEIYLGQRDSDHWTSDEEVLKYFKEFGDELRRIEERITARNKDENLKNRAGPVKVPYTLLYPTSEGGLTGMGIPNSVSI